MDACEFEAVLETFSEAVAEQYIDPMLKFLDVMLLHLAARSAIAPPLLAAQLHERLREMSDAERDTVGARILERGERLCELLAAGAVGEDVLRKLPRIDLKLVWDAGRGDEH